MGSEQILKVGKKAAENAAQVLLDYFRADNKVQFKSDAQSQSTWNLVSEADVKAEERIKETILQAFPDHSILGEESSEAFANKAIADNLLDVEHLWIVDPLDGTNNFCHGLDHFAVSIAYYHKGQPAVGVIHRPASDDWFEVVKGQGATENGETCQTTKTDALSDALIGVGFYYDRGQQMRETLAAIQCLFEQNIRGLRRMGTASLDLCMVGTGRFGGYFEYTLAPWDYAAGKLFVEEAGGCVTNLAGKNFAHGHSGIVAAGATLHPALLKTVSEQFTID